MDTANTRVVDIRPMEKVWKAGAISARNKKKEIYDKILKLN